MRGGPAACALLASALAAGCAPSASPTAVSPPTAAREEVPAPPAANAAPEVLGDLVCRGAMGARHVYPLRIVDPDGDRVSFRARAVEPRGEVHPATATSLASPADVEVVYEPPGDRRDENTIELTVTDARGAVTVVRLTAKSG